MKVEIQGQITHVATGGKPFDASLPTVLFLHGSGMDHRCWALQTRWFAFNGYSVLAPDFPGHSLSQGDPIATIEDTAPWLDRFLDSMGAQPVHLVGHSQGFLSALELASRYPQRVQSITGIATAAAIPVNPALIETAQKSALKAAGMMLQWGFGEAIHMGISPTPGMQPIAIGRQIMGRNPLAVDLQACADYQGGADAAGKIDKPSLMVLADQDRMTPYKAGRAVGEQLNARIDILQGYGHMVPIEAPKICLHKLRDFITGL